jgi:hypothetical protein
MPVTPQVPTFSSVASGAATVFPYPFLVLDEDDLVVTVDGVEQLLNVDYTVSGIGLQTGGDITFNVAPTAGLTVTRYRETELERETDYQENGDLLAEVLDRDFDRLWLALQEFLNGGKSSDRNVRVPAGESIAELPSAANRALKLLGFDAAGQLLVTIPSEQSAAALALLLASNSSPTQGAGMIGFDDGLSYAAGTVGHALLNVTGGGALYYASKLGFTSGGSVDNIAVFNSVKAILPEGSTLILDGLYRISAKLTWDKRISMICSGFENGIYIDVGSSNDGIEFVGTSAGLLFGLNGMRIDLNVYGPAACCQHAVTFSRLDRSDVKVNVRAGALAYGVRVRGSLINTWDIQSTGNYNPPISPAFGLQANHMVVENYGVPIAPKGTASISLASPAVVTLVGHGLSANQAVVFTTLPPSPMVKGKPYFVLSAGLTADTFRVSDTLGGTAINTTASGSATMYTAAAVASNTNDFYVNLEGAAGGVVQTAMPGEGSNTYHGEIEGLTGAPLFIEAALGVRVRELNMEANTTASTFKNIENLHIGAGVINLAGSSAGFNLQTCQGYKIDGYYGALNVDSTNKYGTLGMINSPLASDVVVDDFSCAQISPHSNSTFREVGGGAVGLPTMVCLFANPHFDLYGANDPAVGPPNGCTTRGGAYVSGALTKELTTIYPGSPYITSVKGISQGTDILNGIQITPGIQPWKDDDWISIMVPIYCLNNNGRAEVYIYDGASYHGMGQVETINEWVVVRGSCKLIPGNNWNVTIAISNLAGTYGNGYQYYVGGLNVVKGPIPPRTIDNSIVRLTNVIISNTTPPAFPPAFVGQRYWCPATGKWYMGKDTIVAADWIILN